MLYFLLSDLFLSSSLSHSLSLSICVWLRCSVWISSLLLFLMYVCACVWNRCSAKKKLNTVLLGTLASESVCVRADYTIQKEMKYICMCVCTENKYMCTKSKECWKPALKVRHIGSQVFLSGFSFSSSSVDVLIHSPCVYFIYSFASLVLFALLQCCMCCIVHRAWPW